MRMPRSRTARSRPRADAAGGRCVLVPTNRGGRASSSSSLLAIALAVVCRFAAAFTMAAPQAEDGPSDIIFARMGPGETDDQGNKN